MYVFSNLLFLFRSEIRLCIYFPYPDVSVFFSNISLMPGTFISVSILLKSKSPSFRQFSCVIFYRNNSIFFILLKSNFSRLGISYLFPFISFKIILSFVTFIILRKVSWTVKLIFPASVSIDQYE